jgi:hypothetical protein
MLAEVGKIWWEIGWLRTSGEGTAFGALIDNAA